MCVGGCAAEIMQGGERSRSWGSDCVRVPPPPPQALGAGEGGGTTCRRGSAPCQTPWAGLHGAFGMPRAALFFFFYALRGHAYARQAWVIARLLAGMVCVLLEAAVPQLAVDQGALGGRLGGARAPGWSRPPRLLMGNPCASGGGAFSFVFSTRSVLAGQRVRLVYHSDQVHGGVGGRGFCGLGGGGPCACSKAAVWPCPQAGAT